MSGRSGAEPQGTMQRDDILPPEARSKVQEIGEAG